MIKTKKTLYALTGAFILLEALCAFILYHVSGAFSIASYVYVAAACAFCLLFAEKSGDYLFIQLGLLGTLGADFFLVLLPVQERLPGMLCFTAVQLCYFLRLYTADTNRIRRRVHLILRAAASAVAVAVTIAVLGRGADPVAVVSMLYYVNLALNTIFAFMDWKHTGVLAVGLLCFIISDTVIGLHELKSYFGRDVAVMRMVRQIEEANIDLIYGFYLPSQALIALAPAHKLLKKLQKD